MKKNTKKNFLWGSATSSHQVEGGNFNNDWWEWEKMGKIKTGDSSYVACNHYHRFKEDYSMIKFLNNNSYRFSIEWSRIEPEQGEFDEKEIEHYVEMLEELRKQDIEPVLTLHHFTIPLWLKNIGGVESKEFPAIFASFVKRVIPYFKDYVKYWITINEPVILAYMGYLTGAWPPGIKNMRRAFKVMRNLLFAHAKAYDIIKEVKPDSMISIAHNIVIFNPASCNPLDIWLAKLVNNYFNIASLTPFTDGIIRRPLGNNEFNPNLKNKLDYIGLNYYTRGFIKFTLKGPVEVKKDFPLTDFGYEYYPQGLHEAIMKLKPFNLPIMITENGIADREDKLRSEFLRESVKAMVKAIKEGVELIGYMYWSLMDNFEWVEGYSMRFGLFEVDFRTQERKPRKSALLYKELATKNPYEDDFISL